MIYKFVITSEFEKEFKKLDQSIQRIILKWIKKNIMRIDDSRAFGKVLTGNLKEYWRYRIGDYRLIVDIQDEKFVIIGIHIGHRKDIYK